MFILAFWNPFYFFSPSSKQEINSTFFYKPFQRISYQNVYQIYFPAKETGKD